MNKDIVRIVLWMALFSVGFMLYSEWQNDYPSKKAVSSATGEAKSSATKSSSSYKERADVGDSFPHLDEEDALDIPDAPTKRTGTKLEERKADVVSSAETPKDSLSRSIPKSRLINVKTNVYDVNIDLKGGDIIKMDLLEYLEKKEDYSKGYPLLATTSNKFYVVQSGLLNKSGPDSKEFGRGLYRAHKSNYELISADVYGDSRIKGRKKSKRKVKSENNAAEKLIVDLFYRTKSNVTITKRFTFTQDSYLINVDYIIDNKSSRPYDASLYGRVKRKPSETSSGFMGGMRTFTGAALKTLDKNYQKISFDDIKDESFSQDIKGGWAGMIEHYFTSAWVPDPNTTSTYRTEVLPGNVYGITFVNESISVKPGQKSVVGAQLYAGPEITETLKDISPGLELTVDYGFLWPICQPIFWILKNIHKIVGNWGIAIILTTLVIKLIFFKLSASSYRSMGNMRKLQPKIEALKKRYEGDKQGFGQAVMAMYKKEKVNPLGGCLPILVQIPVFIALYYVLLESVELRHAPFAFWIQDLSVKDPYFVLPLIMGASMLVQQKLSPSPPDPVQAKVMMLMPIFFTFLFLQFPSGLVLYWVVNNVLSIIQQYVITKKIAAQK